MLETHWRSSSWRTFSFQVLRSSQRNLELRTTELFVCRHWTVLDKGHSAFRFSQFSTSEQLWSSPVYGSQSPSAYSSHVSTVPPFLHRQRRDFFSLDAVDCVAQRLKYSASNVHAQADFFLIPSNLYSKGSALLSVVGKKSC
jgi:hypothetical protein